MHAPSRSPKLDPAYNIKLFPAGQGEDIPDVFTDRQVQKRLLERLQGFVGMYLAEQSAAALEFEEVDVKAVVPHLQTIVSKMDDLLPASRGTPEAWRALWCFPWGAFSLSLSLLVRFLSKRHLTISHLGDCFRT